MSVVPNDWGGGRPDGRTSRTIYPTISTHLLGEGLHHQDEADVVILFLTRLTLLRVLSYLRCDWPLLSF